MTAAEHTVVVADADTESFEPVLCHTGWWDCPRSGVALLRGQPHYFLCEFSEALDDYPAEYRLWPIDQETLERELAGWSIFAAWRQSFDSGIKMRPLEENQQFVELHAALHAKRVPPADALVVMPTWHLDTNRSFKDRPPQHEVSWTVLRTKWRD